MDSVGEFKSSGFSGWKSILLETEQSYCTEQQCSQNSPHPPKKTAYLTLCFDCTGWYQVQESTMIMMAEMSTGDPGGGLCHSPNVSNKSATEREVEVDILYTSTLGS
jgi:hypothetical protein